MWNLKSPLMQYLHYLLLYFALILADPTLQNLLFYLYIIPMLIFMIAFENAKSAYLPNKLVFRYSQLAISITIGLAVFNYCSVNYLLIMIPVLIGFPNTKFFYLLRMHSSRPAQGGISIGMFTLFLTMLRSDYPYHSTYIIFISIALLVTVATLMLSTKDFDIIGSDIIACDMFFFNEAYAKPTVQNYVNYLNAGQFKQAYAMLAPPLQDWVSLEGFTTKIQGSIDNMADNEKLDIDVNYDIFDGIIQYDIIYKTVSGKIKSQSIYVFQAKDSSDVTSPWQIYDPMILTLNSQERIVAFCNPKKF